VQPAHLGAEDILEADRPFVEAIRDHACTMQAKPPNSLD
jgi:hypothetical protein